MASIHVQHSGNGKAHAKALNKRAKAAMQEIAQELPRRGRKPLKESEKTPASRFHRIAGIRATRICRLLGRLQSCINRDVYEYDERQVHFMFRQIYTAYKDCKNAFEVALSTPPERRVYVTKKDKSIFETMGSE